MWILVRFGVPGQNYTGGSWVSICDKFFNGKIDKCIAGRQPGSLMKLLRHWWYMIWATLWLLLTFARARWYFNSRAIADLQLPHPESLTSKEKRRLKHYFYGGTFLSVIFSSLRGRTRSWEEKHRLTNLAALAYFFDDLVESFRGRDDTGILWRDNPEEYGLAADDHRRLALHFLHNIYEELPTGHLAFFKEVMHNVFNIETAGRQQHMYQPNLSELAQITREKGGNSVLLFRAVHDPLPTMEERTALLEFGCLIQYCDDIFDVWFDKKEGVSTVATELCTSNQLGELTGMFRQQVQITKAAFYKIPAPRYRIGTALGVVHYIVSITLVCLRHYQSLQKKYGNLPLNDRLSMVVDMEKWKNRWYTAWILVTGVRRGD